MFYILKISLNTMFLAGLKIKYKAKLQTNPPFPCKVFDFDKFMPSFLQVSNICRDF